jgi:putative radical SAM enzyme (TIGR03279 family)
MHISPVNISVHTTNPELRVKMMKNKHSGEVLSYLRTLADAGIKLRGQIVLCKDVNDKEELQRSMKDLCEYYPALDSVSIVPAGLTGYRDGLYPLEPFSADECLAVIKQVTEFGDKCIEKFGERIFYASDEFYVKSGTPLPDFDHYGDFTQIENGVGMLTSFDYEFMCALSTLDDEEKQIEKSITVATGYASYSMMKKLCDRLSEECPKLKINVERIKNNFFGGEVTVTGLLTGKDIAEQLSGKDLGSELYLSRNVLRSEGDLFLCGMTPEELSEKLSVDLVFTENDGGEFLYKILEIEI